jgi:hypothetical protein
LKTRKAHKETITIFTIDGKTYEVDPMHYENIGIYVKFIEYAKSKKTYFIPWTSILKVLVNEEI